MINSWGTKPSTGVQILLLLKCNPQQVTYTQFTSLNMGSYGYFGHQIVVRIQCNLVCEAQSKVNLLLLLVGVTFSNSLKANRLVTTQ